MLIYSQHLNIVFIQSIKVQTQFITTPGKQDSIKNRHKSMRHVKNSRPTAFAYNIKEHSQQSYINIARLHLSGPEIQCRCCREHEIWTMKIQLACDTQAHITDSTNVILHQ